ncbi:MAG: phosphate acyltransferase PlsX [Acidobacteriota bacterium]|nr:phosphate acyltransferase PlsX [Acidobacteriota bacterium]
MSITIAVDAMGADRAPKPEVEGAILAAREYDVRVVLVGQKEIVGSELALHPEARRLPIEVVHASEFIGMDEKAALAVKHKRDSSMRVGLRMVKEGTAAGFVSAGNTGAAMVTAKLVLGVLPGVDRPALATVFPTAANTATIMLDVGANVDCKPQNLQQFAIMGNVYFRAIFSDRFVTASNPRVGLLSVGEEETKGNDLTREAFQLLKALPLNFMGNVEGRDLYNGRADVIVCDGFVGNVALKVSEGMVEAIRAILKETMQATVARQMGFLLARNAFVDFKKRLDYSEYGGAPLLGLKGVAIVSHGSSNGNAIKNAIRVAAEFARSGLNQKIQEEIQAAAQPAADLKA